MAERTTHFQFRRILDRVLEPAHFNELVDALDTKLFALLGESSGAQGELTIAGNVTTTVLTTQNTWYPITAGWTADLSQDITLSAPAGTLTVGVAGLYKTLCTIVFGGLATTKTIEFGLFKNGALVSDIVGFGWTDGAGFVYPNTVTLSGNDNMAAGDVLSLRARCTDSAAVTITVTNANFNVYLVHGPLA